MKIEKILLFTLLVALIFIATIVLFVFKTFTPSPQDRNQPQVTQPKPTATSTKPTTTPTQTNTDSHSAINDCIELKASEAEGKQYERGSLLVTFLSGVDYNTAVESIELLDLKADTSSEAKSNFSQYHWLPVSVPFGTEFQWQCVLDSSEGVRKANLNFTFNLRQ